MNRHFVVDNQMRRSGVQICTHAPEQTAPPKTLSVHQYRGTNTATLVGVIIALRAQAISIGQRSLTRVPRVGDRLGSIFEPSSVRVGSFRV